MASAGLQRLFAWAYALFAQGWTTVNIARYLVINRRSDRENSN